MSKGQSEIMEYMIMVVLIVAAVIGIMLFLSWWNITQLEMKAFSNKQDRMLSIGQRLMAEYMFVDGQAMFDDAKLTSIKAMGSGACGRLEGIFGTNWFAKIRALDMEGETVCTWGEYPDCNVWVICGRDARNVSQKFPVNVYRKASDRVALGILEVGIY